MEENTPEHLYIASVFWQA